MWMGVGENDVAINSNDGHAIFFSDFARLKSKISTRDNGLTATKKNRNITETSLKHDGLILVIVLL